MSNRRSFNSSYLIKKVSVWIGCGVLTLILGNCGAPPKTPPSEVRQVAPAPVSSPPSSEAPLSEAVDGMVAPKRTGIATGWGREVKSSMTYRSFIRSSVEPICLSTINYNHRQGAQEMGVNLKQPTSPMQQIAGGNLEWGMEGSSSLKKNYRWRGRRFAIGEEGDEYGIKLRNLSDARVEVVVSVDGLDVIDGRPASTKKRGYLIAPGATLMVKGFRTSSDSMAAFEFSSVRESYAQLKHGNPRNVGVIGLAVFYEKGALPGSEVIERAEARAFAEAPMSKAQ
jgi:hypothetical protein